MKILKSMGPGMAPEGVCNYILNIFNVPGDNRFVFLLLVIMLKLSGLLITSEVDGKGVCASI